MFCAYPTCSSICSPLDVVKTVAEKSLVISVKPPLNGHLPITATIFYAGGPPYTTSLWPPLCNGHFLVSPRWPLWSRVRYIMLENSSIMLLSVTQKNLVLCPKLCSKNIALCSPDFYCIQHVLITTV